jgi:hypothetical protein
VKTEPINQGIEAAQDEERRRSEIRTSVETPEADEVQESEEP